MLAVVMMVLAVPFAAVAATATDSVVSAEVDANIIKDDKLLLSLAHIGADPVKGAAAEGDITLTTPKCGASTVTSSGDGTLSVTDKKTTWFSYGRATNLPLQKENSYTITYTATLPENGATPSNGATWSLFGFLFNISGDATATNVGDKSITLWCSINTGDPNTLKVYQKNTGANSSSN